MEILTRGAQECTVIDLKFMWICAEIQRCKFVCIWEQKLLKWLLRYKLVRGVFFAWHEVDLHFLDDI